MPAVVFHVRIEQAHVGGAAIAGPREVEEVACQRGPARGIVQRQFVSRQAVVEGVGEGDSVVLATLAGVFADRLEDGVLQDEIGTRSEEHTSELQSLMRISYAVFGLKKKQTNV